MDVRGKTGRGMEGGVPSNRLTMLCPGMKYKGLAIEPKTEKAKIQRGERL